MTTATVSDSAHRQATHDDRNTGPARVRRYLFLAACACTVVLYVWHALSVNFLADDGYIAFRYVKNLLAGHGLNYNPGERCEGYTQFLWIVLLAGVQRLFPQAPLVDISRSLGVTFGVATIALTAAFSRRLRPSRFPLNVMAPAFLAFDAGFTAWATAGLETTLFSLLILAAAFLYVRYLHDGRGLYWVPAIFALATLTRPDGVLFFAVTGLHAMWVSWRRDGRPFNRSLLLCIAIFAAIYLPYFAWRYHYYGYLLPNTFYAKVGGGFHQYARGFSYLLHYAKWHGFFLFLPIFVPLLSRRRVLWRDYLALLAAAYTLYIIYVGGDGLHFFRFVVYISPIIYLLVQDGLIEVFDWARARPWYLRAPVRYVATSALAAFCVASLLATGWLTLSGMLLPRYASWYEPHSELTFPGRDGAHPYLWFENYFVARQAVAAEWLDAHAGPDATVASTPAGSIAYHSRLRVIDMLGLNDVHIAHTPGVFGGVPGKGRAGHEKGDGAYVLRRAPEYILMGNVAVLPFPLTHERMPEKIRLKSEHELWKNPDFHAAYELKTVRLADAGPFQYFSFYQRKAPATTATTAE